MAKLETVKVEADNKGGFMTINKSDLTRNDTLFVEKCIKIKIVADNKKGFVTIDKKDLTDEHTLFIKN